MAQLTFGWLLEIGVEEYFEISGSSVQWVLVTSAAAHFRVSFS